MFRSLWQASRGCSSPGMGKETESITDPFLLRLARSIPIARRDSVDGIEYFLRMDILLELVELRVGPFLNAHFLRHFAHQLNQLCHLVLCQKVDLEIQVRALIREH